MTRWRSSGNGSEEEMKSGQDIGKKWFNDSYRTRGAASSIILGVFWANGVKSLLRAMCALF